MRILGQLQSGRPSADRRTTIRRKLSLEGQEAMLGQRSAPVVIHDLSTSGLLAQTSAAVTVGEQIEVELPEAGPTSATVAWKSGSYFGCQFDVRLSSAWVSAALLRSSFEKSEQTSVLGARNLRPADPENGSRTEMSLRTRLWIILGFALVSWALVLAIILSAF